MKPMIPGATTPAHQQTAGNQGAQAPAKPEPAQPKTAGPRFPAWDLLPPEQILNFRRRGG